MLQIHKSLSKNSLSKLNNWEQIHEILFRSHNTRKTESDSVNELRVISEWNVTSTQCCLDNILASCISPIFSRFFGTFITTLHSTLNCSKRKSNVLMPFRAQNNVNIMVEACNERGRSRASSNKPTIKAKIHVTVKRQRENPFTVRLIKAHRASSFETW